MSGTRLDIRVMPRSPRAGIDGVRNGRVVVRVTAAPVDGAANDAVVRVMAEALGIARGSMAIVAGEKARNKTIAIHGLTEAAVRQRLAVAAS